MDFRKQTRLVERTGSKRFGRPSLKGAKLLGSSVKSALGNTSASFRHKRNEIQPEEDDDDDSCFFHDDDDAVRMTAMDMFWSQHVRKTKTSNVIDEEDLSSTGFSDSVSESSSLIKSAHTTNTAFRSSNHSELDTTNRSAMSAKTLDPSDLWGTKSKKKELAPKRIDFTGHIVESDDEEDDDALSRKSKGSRSRRGKGKKSKKRKSSKKKKKSKKGVQISIAEISDDDAVIMGGSSFEDSAGGAMVSGDIIGQEEETMASEETKIEEDDVKELLAAPRPCSIFQRQTTSGTAASAFSADPSITHVMERIALEDEKYSDRKVQKELEQEVEDLLDENDDLHAELEEEIRRNEKLKAELSRMQTKLDIIKLKHLKKDDMEILHEEIKRLQDELNHERRQAKKNSRESRSEIAELQQTVDSLREEVSLASSSFRSLNNSSLNRSSHSDNGSNSGRLQEELLVANAKIEELEKSHRDNGNTVGQLRGELLVANRKIEVLDKIRVEQQSETRKLRHLLDRFKENTGVKELEERLEASENEAARLRLELENVEKDSEEKMRSKEETIEFFLKEVSSLKLQQASIDATSVSKPSLNRGRTSMRKLAQSEVSDVVLAGSEELTSQPKRFNWLRGRRQV